MINKDHAEADLRLLQLASPLHFQIKRFSRDPRRYAEEILYALLDLKSQEDIRLNRRQHASDPEKKESDKDSEGEKEPAAGPEDKSEGEKEPVDESESKSEGGTEGEKDPAEKSADKMSFAEKMKAAREAKKAEKKKQLEETKKELEQQKNAEEAKSKLETAANEEQKKSSRKKTNIQT
ncbi:MAG: hypothetical protein PHN80_16140 [Hespellia sp.]|nr:hypothetical protein [Hespellia sp.]